MEDQVNESTNLINSDQNTRKSICDKISTLKLELAMMFVFLGWNLSSQLVPNILLKNTCLLDGYNNSICDNLNENNFTRHIEEQIQPRVAQIITTTTLVSTIIPAIFNLFLLPWSDKFGRKKVICATLIGAGMSMTAFVFVRILDDWFFVVNPWIYVLPNFPLILTGGWPSMVGAIFCYMSDSSTESDRSSRMIFFESTIFTATFVATISCTYVLAVTSVTMMFVISAVMINAAMFYILVFVDESLQNPENGTVKKQICGILTSKSIKEMLVTCFKRRADNNRRIMWCFLTIIILTIIAMNGFENVFYLFTRKKFQWNLRDFTLFNSALQIFAILGNFIGVTILKRLLNFSDFSLIFIAITSKLLDSITKVFVNTTLLMYLTSALCMLKVLAPVMCKSLISTIVSNNELGRIFCVMGSIEALSSLVSSPLYTFVYSKTFTFFPSAFFLITCFIAVVNLIIAVYAKYLKNSQEI